MSSTTINSVGNSAPAKNIDANYTKYQSPSLNKSLAKQANQDKTEKAKDISPKNLKKIIDKINENVNILNQDVKFSYNDTIKSLTVKVIDASTGKLIREIPPKEVINLQKKLSEVVGIIFDSKEVK